MILIYHEFTITTGFIAVGVHVHHVHFFFVAIAFAVTVVGVGAVMTRRAMMTRMAVKEVTCDGAGPGVNAMKAAVMVVVAGCVGGDAAATVHGAPSIQYQHASHLPGRSTLSETIGQQVSKLISH